MASQAITLFIAFVGCWGSGLKIFMRLYYPMWITEIAMAIIIAMMGASMITPDNISGGEEHLIDLITKIANIIYNAPK